MQSSATSLRALTRSTLQRLDHLAPPDLVRRAFLRTVARAGEDVVVRLATTPEELSQALTVLHEAYVRRGILDPGTPVRVPPHTLLEGTTTFVAVRGGQVIGTLSLIEDGPAGLPMESTHPDEVAAARSRGLRIAEVGTLAVAPEHRDRLVSLHLYNAMYRWAHRHRAVDHLLIAVHPRIETFFRRVLMFERLGPERSYQSLNAAPSLPLRLDLGYVDERYRIAYERPGMGSSIGGNPTTLWRYFVADPTVEGVEIAAEPLEGHLSPTPTWDEDAVAMLHDRLATGVRVEAIEVETLEVNA